MLTLHKSIAAGGKEHMISIRHHKGGKGVSAPGPTIVQRLKLSTRRSIP